MKDNQYPTPTGKQKAAIRKAERRFYRAMDKINSTPEGQAEYEKAARYFDNKAQRFGIGPF